MGWEMFENTLVEEEEGRGVERRRLRERRGISGDHKLLTTTKCFGYGL